MLNFDTKTRFFGATDCLFLITGAKIDRVSKLMK